MTITQFLKLLKQTPRKWQVYYTTLRYREQPELGLPCPINRVCFDTCGTCGGPTEAAEDARQLGLSAADAARIIGAADGCREYDLALRKKLLKACGLEAK